MSTKELTDKINSLPPDKREEIEKIVDGLFTKESGGKQVKNRQAGFGKGLIEILPGFDDPIEGLEEYA